MRSPLDFTGAIFNECCLSLYDSRDYKFGGDIGQLTRIDNDGEIELLDDNQRAVQQCGAELRDTCPGEGDLGERMFPAIVDTVLSSLGGNIVDLLCHCYTDQDRFDKFIEFFNAIIPAKNFGTFVSRMLMKGKSLWLGRLSTFLLELG